MSEMADHPGYVQGTFFSTTVLGREGMPDFQAVTFTIEGALSDLKTVSYEEIVAAYRTIFEHIETARDDQLRPDFVQTLLLNEIRETTPDVLLAHVTTQRSLEMTVTSYAEHLLDVTEVPIKASPLKGIDLNSLLLGGSSISILFGSFTPGHNPIVVIAVVGASVVVLGAARGVGEALHRGLYVKTLNLLRVPEQTAAPRSRSKKAA